MGYGVDTVGFLAAISALNLVTTPRMGAWADKVGAYKARTTCDKYFFWHIAFISLEIVSDLDTDHGSRSVPLARSAYLFPDNDQSWV